MSQLQNTVWTFKLNGGETFTLAEEDGITSVSIKQTTGTSTLLGTKKVQDKNPVAVDIAEGQVLVISVQQGVCCFTLTVAGGGLAEIIAT